MEHNQIVFTVLSLLVFLLSGAFLRLLVGKLKIPFTLLLVIIGIIFAVTSNFSIYYFSFLQPNPNTGEISFLHHFLNTLGNFKLSPDMVFFIFLPTLLFESAFNLRLSQLRQSIIHITTLSIFSLTLSVGLIGASFYYLFDFPWLYALLFGVIISATDPVAVLGIFKEVGAPKRLRTIVEGESLFNDGTALVFFNILKVLLVALIAGNYEEINFISGFENFAWNIFGGILFGGMMGYFFSKIIEHIHDKKNVEMSFTLVLAHITFLFGELIHVSPIIATVIAGIILGNYGRHKISPIVLETMHHFWDHMAFIVNTLVFILIGISIANSASYELWILSLAAIPIVFIARFFSVIPVMSLTNLILQKQYRVSLPWQIIVSHGGLRGALAVVMLLSLPEDFEHYELFQSMAVSVITFLLLFNGMTIKWLLKKFGLMDFSPTDTLETEESHVLVSHSMQEHLDKLKRKNYVSQPVYEKLSRGYKTAELKAVGKIRKMLHRDNKFTTHQLLLILKKHCLGVENKIFHQLFAAEEITENTLWELSGSTERQRERILLGVEQEKKRRNTDKNFIKRLKEKECLYKQKRKFLQKYVFFQKWLKNWKRKKITQKHERYRARRISAWNVLKYLDELEKNALFIEEGILETVRNQYKKWYKNSEKKQIEIEKHFPEFLKHRKFYLTKRNCYSLERKIINDLFDRAIIDQKVYISLQDALLERIKRIRKDATRDEETT